MIEARLLSKSYYNGAAELEVLKEINLVIRAKEFVAIQGPSGAGKSTLLHILGGLDYPTKGRVFFSGQDLYDLSDNERALIRNKRIGFVFQFFHLLPELSAIENVMLPALIKSWWQRKKAESSAIELLNLLGLGARVLHKPNELSGGEQQRLAIARALINSPEALFCDEPTGNLDSENGENILGIIKNLRDKINLTVILVTHDNDIARNADRVVRLKDGVIF